MIVFKVKNRAKFVVILKKVDTHLACRSAWLTAGLDFIFLMLSWSAKEVTCSSVREVSKYSVIVLDIICSLNILSSTDSLAT